MSRDAATQAQVTAGRPDRSSWVSANAGSGKTRVLTDRVARLLLRGADPQRILCLTYTKAAASEMQNRLFDRLGQWSMLPDADLRKALSALDEARIGISDRDLARARTLFARALETPGGLKIQTIHAFCEAQLRRFPLEADVTPGFQVLEDRAATQLRAQTLDALAQEPGSGFEALSPFLVNKDLQLDATLAEIVRQRDRLSLSPDSPSLIQAFGLDRPAPDLARALDAQTLTALIEGIAAAGGKKAQAALPALHALRAGANDALAQLQPHFTRGDGEAKTHQIATKSLTAVVPEAEAHILAVAEAVSGALEHQNAQHALAQTQALLHFAQHFITAYDARKRAQGVLEFDDMIRATDRLLNRAEVADWVRYRLDGGIHHILVDEAQDTSPAQWRVIDALTQEFFAGAGSTTAPRTVFVVGDRKQSIYSFQGADPVAFGAQETRYADALTDIDDTLERCDLLHSFRSSEPILQLVDQVFLGVPEISATHVAFKTDLPGRVELWPWTEKAEEAPPKPWSDPVDQERPGNATLLLAAEVADWLAGHLANQTSLPGTGRALSAGDVLILVRSRGPLFRGLLSALKAAGVPVAGADRLKVNDQLIVKDLLGLLCAVATEADDLNLAAALRSPLFGLSEQDLFTLAHDREASLTQALAAAADRHPEAWALLSDLRASADYLRPFELLSRILTRHGTAPRIEARLGAEAVEAVDELLNLALEYEQVEPPTLTGFLEWMQAGNPDVKRQLDPKSGQVRVMTVHGAKGLEAPLVILPDTGTPRDNNSDTLVPLGADLATLRMPQADQPPRALRKAAETRKALDAEERSRLLYVALTRAEQWLVIAGAGEAPKDGSWHRAAQTALETLGARPDPNGHLTLSHNWSDQTADRATVLGAPPASPTWLHAKVPPPPKDPAPISPSRDCAAFLSQVAPAPSPQDPEAARLAGIALHTLLEHLPTVPPQDRPRLAQTLLEALPEAPPPEAHPALITRATALITQPDLAWIFAPDTLTEVPVAGRVAALNNQKLSGKIDRLVIHPDTVWIIDYKSNAVPEDPLPRSIAGQLALYVIPLQQIFPKHQIRACVLWTATGGLTELHHVTVKEVLQSATPH